MGKFRAWIFLAVGLFLGFLVGAFGKSVFNLTWKSEIGLGDLLNFANTIIFAFLLQQYFQKRFGDKRVEKDHIIVLIKENINWLEAVREKFIVCYNKTKVSKADDHEMLALLKNFSNSLESLKVSLVECKYEEDIKIFEQGLDNLYIEYKRNLTTRSFTTKTYNANNFNEEETLYQKIRSKFLVMIFQVNKR